MTKPSYVYCVKADDKVKIGITTDVSARIKALQTSNPHRVELCWLSNEMTDAEARQEERHWHMFYCDYRTLGEWFMLTDDMDNGFKRKGYQLLTPICKNEEERTRAFDRLLGHFNAAQLAKDNANMVADAFIYKARISDIDDAAISFLVQHITHSDGLAIEAMLDRAIAFLDQSEFEGTRRLTVGQLRMLANGQELKVRRPEIRFMFGAIMRVLPKYDALAACRKLGEHDDDALIDLANVVIAMTEHEQYEMLGDMVNDFNS